MAPSGYVALVLHAHLPFVRHPEYPAFLEEDWLYEAITETYLPLLQVFEHLASDRVPFRLTLTLSPTLVSMLQDDLLMARYSTRLDRLSDLAAREVVRTRGDAPFQSLALFYRDRFEALRRSFHDVYRCDLIGAFRRLQDSGFLEIITSAATHAYLPLMAARPESVRAQIAVAVAHYRRAFGRAPRGIWLPECGYFPGIEDFLAEEDLRFFFVDAHGISDAEPRPVYGIFAPVFTEAGVAAFGRDPESSEQVWSAERGYPGDPHYRDFYRDVGWDLDHEYVRPYIQATGQRKNTGIKYYRITGRTEHKELYDPRQADRVAERHAGHFMFNRERQIEYAAARMEGRPPIVVAPYDAELFGHWWFEGPAFLDRFIRKCAAEQTVFALTTPADYLCQNPEAQLVELPMCSWGEQGYSAMWLDGSNDWIYRHLLWAAKTMVRLADDFPLAEGVQRRALNQAARELMLAQSSDWAFIMKTGTMVDYAVRRTQEHVLRFLKLNDQLRSGKIDEEWLGHAESKNNLFPELDYRIYRSGR